VKLERTVEIAAPPERVYDVVMDPGRLEEWVSIHHHLEDAPEGLLKQGSKLTQVLKLAGQKFHVRWTVVENQPCERVVWEGRGPVTSHARVVYGFQENGGGTRFSYANEYDLPGGPLGRLAGRTVSRVTAKEVDETLTRLKRLVETRADNSE
jgi:carbon monoxide dehydrogenase subunit G